MFPSPKRVPPPTIKILKSNNTIITFEGLKFNGEDKTTISERESILFIVKSPMGTTVLSKTLVGSEGIETPIEFGLLPEETLHIFAPFVYHYSLDLYRNSEGFFYTLQRGDVIIGDPIGTIEDINQN